MKLINCSLALAFCLLATVADAFSVTNPTATSRPDATSAVEEALKITASFGIDSKQAKVAWDTVEELSASDNRYAICWRVADCSYCRVFCSAPFANIHSSIFKKIGQPGTYQ